MKKKKLFICSCGLRAGQLTPETARALKLCSVVFSHSLAGGPVASIVRGFCPDLRPLVNLSPDEIVRAIKAALKTRPAAAFLTYGNPFFLNEAASLLKRELERSGAEVEVLPAVSSFDAIVNMLPLGEFSPAGLRLLHAGLSGGEVEFFPGMDTLVFMPDKLNRAERPEHACARKKFLSRAAAAYPAGHPAWLVNAPFMEDLEGRLVRATIGTLGRALRRADRNTTLYIPAVKTRR